MCIVTKYIHPAALSATLAAVMSLAAVGCHSDNEPHGQAHGGGQGQAAEVTKGPHGGRLLAEGGFALEVTIYESGVPPEFRVFAYEDGKPLAPNDFGVHIELQRFGGVVDRISFSAVGDYLRGEQEIYEPHSFDVVVTAKYRGVDHRWTYESYEGRTRLVPEAVKIAGISTETAGPATITSGLTLSGRVVPNEDRMIRVATRYAGVVRQARKRLGDQAAKDEVLAVVESNESLQPFDVRSEIAGTIIAKDVSTGEFAAEGASIYTVADLSTVWVDLTVLRSDYERLNVGQEVTVASVDESKKATGTLVYLSPLAAEGTQTMLARAELPNAKGEWRPGVFVTGEVSVETVEVPVAVRNEAVQTYRDWEVVFMNDGDVFEIAILELGRRDEEWAEVLSGIKPGQSYVGKNSFIIKADIGKSGASHDH